MRALFTAPMGADFWKLWTASAVTNVGDGITMVAGPLLVTSLTSSPAAVAGAAFAQQLPWLLFALISGAWADRLDRRRLVVAVNLLRAAALATLAVAVTLDNATVPLILAVFFLLGTGETLADTASAAFVPAIVPAASRPRANSLMYANFNVLNQFAAKPLGGWLFVVAAAVPFAVNAVTFAVSAALIATIRAVSPRPAPSASVDPRSPGLRAEIAEGVRWLMRHRLLRTLALTMAVGNVAFCAAFAIFVLHAEQRLGLNEVGYGTLLIAFAAGGFLGTLAAPALIRRFDAAPLLRLGLLIEVALHATLALTRNPLTAAAMIVVFGIHTTVWGVVATTLRQRDVPPAMFGRVTSVYSFLDLGGAALGSLLGGAIAGAYGVVTPYWVAAVAMTLVAAAAWRPLGSATLRTS
ncbi:MFS transporter [Paractinoplanes abujensis]|uniref:MFS family permease n=1 Tax=Paractinoplanes abujensis TaxID=882441 RepID=A0A7W7CVL3_9ACTN|nr:MFS transporter [Actinoplanes abujensis]MBB4695461.1 MFS family permease [Actinoplanes abujensis]GID23045.1 MFS transporter [Actinoplanes abujensis]